MKLPLIKTAVFLSIIALAIAGTGCAKQLLNNVPGKHATKAESKKMSIKIILGSTRKGRTSDKLGSALELMAKKRNDVAVEILDLRDFNLPFLNDEVPPARREKITDPAVQRWADKINEAQGFIIVVPEYNAGYPGVLKNALDILYKEWNGKTVAFVGYSGGSSGGSSAIAQLRQVAAGLEMVTVATDIKIPSAWKAFDTKGNLENKNIESELNTLIDQVIATRTAAKK